MRIRHATKSNLVAAILFTIVLVGCSEEQPVATEPVIRPVRSMVVGDATQLAGRRFPGIARASQEVDVSFRVSGPLIQFPANVGDNVSSGQLLAQIDPRDYEVNLLAVQSQLERALAAQQRGQAEYDRVQRIMNQDPGATSQRALDSAIDQRDQSRASVASLQASVAAAEDQLSYTTLSAPFDGSVVATYAENFEVIRASQSIVRIVNDNRIEMVVDIPESLISLVPTVAEIQVEFDAFAGRSIPAQISEVSNEASPITRTYPVTLIMDQPADFRILAGMAGQASASVEQQAGVVAVLDVPLSALLTDGQANSFVWVIDGDSMAVSKTRVETGSLTDFGILITSGIQTGDRVVTAGVSYLIEGQKVRLFEIESE